MNLTETKDKVLMGLIGLIVAGAVSFSAWVTIEINKRPTTDEVSQKIQNEAPYIRDQQLIMSAVEESKANTKALREAIQNNTQAVIELRAVLEVIRDDK